MLQITVDIGEKLGGEQVAGLQQKAEGRRGDELKGGYAELGLFYYGFGGGEEADFGVFLRGGIFREGWRGRGELGDLS